MEGTERDTFKNISDLTKLCDLIPVHTRSNIRETINLFILTSEKTHLRQDAVNAVILPLHEPDVFTGGIHLHESGSLSAPSAIQVDGHPLVVAWHQTKVSMVEIKGKYAKVMHLRKHPGTRGGGSWHGRPIDTITDQSQGPAIEQTIPQAIAPPIVTIELVQFAEQILKENTHEAVVWPTVFFPIICFFAKEVCRPMFFPDRILLHGVL